MERILWLASKLRTLSEIVEVISCACSISSFQCKIIIKIKQRLEKYAITKISIEILLQDLATKSHQWFLKIALCLIYIQNVNVASLQWLEYIFGCKHYNSRIWFSDNINCVSIMKNDKRPNSFGKITLNVHLPCKTDWSCEGPQPICFYILPQMYFLYIEHHRNNRFFKNTKLCGGPQTWHTFQSSVFNEILSVLL